MSVTLILGPYIFQDYSIPQVINGGGEQALAVHQLVGGQRVIDAMGRVDDDVSWSGLLFGSNALADCQFLDSLRVAGFELPLIYSQFNYLVLIRGFRFEFEREYQIRYTITCTILQNLNFPFNLNNPISFATAILNLLNQGNALAGLINIPSVTTAMNNLSIQINAVPNFDNATAQQLSPVGASCAAAQTTVASSVTTINQAIF